MSKLQKTALYITIATSLVIFLILFFLMISKNSKLFLIDNNVANMFYNNRSRFFDYFFVIISYMGETKIIATVCIILLLLPNRKKLGIPLTIITVFSVAINFAVKLIVMRHRPDGLFLTNNTLGYNMPTGYSFPSGHAQTANIFYFALSYLTLANIKKKWQKIFFICAVSVFCILMCIARVYLCVHFLSDVICGICLMTSILLGGILIYETRLKHLFYLHE